MFFRFKDIQSEEYNWLPIVLVHIIAPLIDLSVDAHKLCALVSQLHTLDSGKYQLPVTKMSKSTQSVQKPNIFLRKYFTKQINFA